jgi:hypothetical protein
MSVPRLPSLDAAAARALTLFDAANAQDPHREGVRPKELLYAERMSAMLARFAPRADAAAQLAVRAQHIERWRLPRDQYPATREGYLSWRTALYKVHAETAGRLMREAGCAEDLITQVQQAVGKRGLKVNPLTQLVEDIAGLVFIEHYMADFAAGKPDYDEAKWLNIIRKTWKKMSPEARRFALECGIVLPPGLEALIIKAVTEEQA